LDGAPYQVAYEAAEFIETGAAHRRMFVSALANWLSAAGDVDRGGAPVFGADRRHGRGGAVPRAMAAHCIIDPAGSVHQVPREAA
jgi:hypothetical protein